MTENKTSVLAALSVTMTSEHFYVILVLQKVLVLLLVTKISLTATTACGGVPTNSATKPQNVRQTYELSSVNAPGKIS